MKKFSKAKLLSFILTSVFATFMNGAWAANYDSQNPAPSDSLRPSTKFRVRRRSGPFNQLAQRVLHRRRRLTGVCAPLLGALSQCLIRFMPIVQWLPRYNWRECFFSDLSAGLTMAVFSVPTGIAHASICGVAPVYGLYTAIFPTFFYLLFGNSKHNALGGFAILSLMTRSAIEKVYRLMHTLNSNSTLLVNVTSAIAAGVAAGQGVGIPPPLLLPTTTTTTTIQPNLFSNESSFLALNESSVFGTGAETSFFEGAVDFGMEVSTNFSLESNETEVSSIFDDPVLAVFQSYPNPSDGGETGSKGAGGSGKSGVQGVGGQFGELRPIHIATTIVFLSAIFQILMGIFRLDFLSCYLSEQVMAGFVVGGCVHVFFSQIGDVLGIQLPTRSGRGYLYYVSASLSKLVE